MPRLVLCPYCGDESTRTDACGRCGGRFDPLSRQATINALGPWMVRNPARPFHPGCSYEIICQMVASGKIRPDTVLRGPTTGQFWSTARRTPGVAGLLGICYACQKRVPTGSDQIRPDRCPACGAATGHVPDRQHLGLGPVHLLPGRDGAPGIQSPLSPEAHPLPGSTGRHNATLIAIVVLAMLAAGGIAAWLLGQSPSPGSSLAESGVRTVPPSTPKPSGRPEPNIPAHTPAEHPAPPDSDALRGNPGAIDKPEADRDADNPAPDGWLTPATAQWLVSGDRESMSRLIEKSASDTASEGVVPSDVARKRLQFLDFREWFGR